MSKLLLPVVTLVIGLVVGFAASSIRRDAGSVSSGESGSIQGGAPGSSADRDSPRSKSERPGADTARDTAAIKVGRPDDDWEEPVTIPRDRFITLARENVKYKFDFDRLMAKLNKADATEEQRLRTMDELQETFGLTDDQKTAFLSAVTTACESLAELEAEHHTIVSQDPHRLEIDLGKAYEPSRQVVARLQAEIAAVMGEDRTALLDEVLPFKNFYLPDPEDTVRTFTIEQDDDDGDWMAWVRRESGGSGSGIGRKKEDAKDFFSVRWHHLLEKNSLEIPEEVFDEPDSGD